LLITLGLVGEPFKNKMKLNRIKGKLILVGVSFTAVSNISFGQVTDRGLSSAANTTRSYNDASIARDSGLSQPLDLLNDFYPAIEVTIADHDNVRRRPDFDESDLKIVATPSLAYRTNFGRHQFYAAYTGTFTFHDDLSQEDAQSNAINAKLGLDLARRWDLDLFGGFGNSYEERGISGSRGFENFTRDGFDRGPEEVDYFNYGADLIFGRKTGIVTAVLGFEHNEVSFSNAELLNAQRPEDRDREVDSLHLDVNWQFAAKTSVFGRIQQYDTDYDSPTTTLDSEQTDYLIGLRWKPSAALSGVVGLGRSDKDFDDVTRAGYDGDIYYANLNYRINPFSNISLAASRTIEEPGDELANFYDSEFVGVGWNHALTPKLVFDVYAKWIDDDYDIGREDKFQDWGVGLDYIWRNWLTAGIYYGEVERESSLGNSVAYDDAYFGIRLRSDLRSLFSGRRNDDEEPRPYGPDTFDYPKKTEPSQ